MNLRFRDFGPRRITRSRRRPPMAVGVGVSPAIGSGDEGQPDRTPRQIRWAMRGQQMEDPC
jgi:hypothetical protein